MQERKQSKSVKDCKQLQVITRKQLRQSVSDSIKKQNGIDASLHKDLQNRQIKIHM